MDNFLSPEPAAIHPGQEGGKVPDAALQTSLPLRQRVVNFQAEHPHAATVLESAAVWAGRQATAAVVQRATGVRLGHGWHNSRLGKRFNKPAVAVATGLVLAPVLEELVVRKIPSDVLDKQGSNGSQKAVGTAVAAVFAVGHAGKEAIPVPQFIGGLNYWRLMRHRGYKHAVVAHATQNALSLAKSAMQMRLHR